MSSGEGGGAQGEVSRGCVWTDNRKAKRRENWGAEGGQSSVKIEKLFRSGSDEGGGEVGGGARSKPLMPIDGREGRGRWCFERSMAFLVTH